MSPSGLSQTVLKETSGNTDFCYYVADRIAPRYIRFIYACTDTPIYVYINLLRDRRERVSDLNIHISSLLYISVDQVYFSYRVSLQWPTLLWPYPITTVIKFSRGHFAKWNHRSTVVLDQSDLIVIIVTRISKVRYEVLFSPRNSQSLSGNPLRR